MTARHPGNRHVRIVGRFVKKPKPVAEGEARCAGCNAAVKLTPTGRLRKHRSPSGEDCAYVVTHGTPVHLEEMPEVNLGRPAARWPGQKRPEGEPSRLDVGSNCQVCNKWLPGERSLCGACYVRGETNRKKKAK